MDLVGACRAFVYVSDRGGFTPGAAAARIPQPVASRRVAALERHLGGQLFDRSTRRAVLTPFGREVLPAARRLVRLAEELEYDAERARHSPLRLAVPETCATRDLAALGAAGRDAGLRLDFRPGPPAVRAAALRDREVRAAVVAVPPVDAAWRVPLGVGSATAFEVRTLYLGTLRVGRGERPGGGRRLWIQPEDDVPHVRDPLSRSRDALGLGPGQVLVASSLADAATEVLVRGDLLLCPAGQAEALGLYWCALGEPVVERGYDLVAQGQEETERLRAPLAAALAHCLDAVPDPAAPEPAAVPDPGRTP
ncbi:LysR family transcriptional regulator [Nocardiopsis changdeensis]|uniref:LysR family transcriptional regulator n=1 Tax=Nocardiopsis changdeensis TaxID=2831969 RepID=A0ABX8BG10_9ACTN|nr:MULTISPECIES: LysR family transcriptional regulator [Nocardiopsis]QUX20223.1 LysR family transcriptional regulator [Nocardiopsis changdeensis]QYX36151.1 LysR family transcriptional regulator [Nocardiopsis sp. MT53]